MYVIYDIECAVNGKHYIGYTSKSGAERFAMHLNNARWRRPGALYDAIRVYGPDKFSVTEIAVCKNHADGCFVEEAIIADRGCLLPNGYNMTFGGDGVPVTREAIERASEKRRKLRGENRTEKQKAYDATKRGKKHSPEHVAKCIAKRVGRKHSAEWRENISKGNRGLRRSEEARAAMSRAKRGRPWTLLQHLTRALTNEARRQGIPIE